MKKILVSIITVLLFVSCANTKPLRSLENNKIPSGLSNEKIVDSIKRAGKYRGWSISQDKKQNNNYIGKLFVRKHYLEIDIELEKKSYAISYRDSRHMKYNSSNGTIHRNYYRWVTNLITEINRELAIAESN